MRGHTLTLETDHPFYSIIEKFDSIKNTKPSYIVVECSNLQKENDVAELLIVNGFEDDMTIYS